MSDSEDLEDNLYTSTAQEPVVPTTPTQTPPPPTTTASVKKKESFWKRNAGIFRRSTANPSINSTRSSSQQQLISRTEVLRNSEEISPPPSNNYQSTKSKIKRPRSAGDITQNLHHCSLTNSPASLSTDPSGVTISPFPGSSSPRPNHLEISTRHSSTENSNNLNNNHTLTTTTPSKIHPHSNSGGGGGGSGLRNFFKFKNTATKHLEIKTVECVGGSPVLPPSNNNTDLRYTKLPLSPSKISSALPPSGGTNGSSSSSNSTGLKLNCSLKSSKFSLDSSSSSSSAGGCDSIPTPSDSSITGSIAISSFDLHSSSSPEVISNSLFDQSQIQFTPQTRTYGHPHRSPLPFHHPPSTTSTTPSTGNFLTQTVSSFGRKVVNSVTPSSHKSSSSSSKKNKSKLKVKSKSDNNLHHQVNLQSSSSSSTGIPVPRNSSASTFTSYLSSSDHQPLSLNSVQLGDHAQIRLPWTPTNNLSGGTPSPRTNIPQTHTNHFPPNPSSSDRYVTPSSLPQSSLRRRSRSLERCSNLRIHQLTWRELENLTSLTSSSTPPSTTPPSLHRIHRNLSSLNETSILLRNISPSIPTHHPAPPKRPSKSPKTIFTVDRLPRSAPTSSISNSSESGDSATSYSAPPSPPPRPPSTLKPNSTLIIHPTHYHHRKSTSTMLASLPKPKKATASSGGSSSDSGVSHAGSSTSTIRGGSSATGGGGGGASSEFSDESAGSVNIVSQSQKVSTSSSAPVTTTSGSSTTSGTNNSTAVHTPVATTVTSAVSTVGAGASANAAPPGISIEDVRNSGFINKPQKGWLHSDNMLSKEGVSYTVRYIGCLDVNTSMKSLDFDTRSLIAKECINQVCEAAGLRSQDKKRKVDRRVVRILGVRPRLEHAGSDVRLTITSTCLKLTSLDTGSVIAVHDMPNISFASGGDATMLDFVAYVAKDQIVGRACFVLECGSGLAQDVITTVGQAFELRFKEYLQKRPPPPRVPVDDPEYYNDLPGKLPPDSVENKVENVQGVGGARGNLNKAGNSRAREPPPLNLHSTTSDKELSVNLIDFEAPTPPAFLADNQLETFLLPQGSAAAGGEKLQNNQISNGGGGAGANNLGVGGTSTGLGLPNSPSHHNSHSQQGSSAGAVGGGGGGGVPSSSSQKDPFDMQPFAATLQSPPQPIPPEIVKGHRRLLEGEIWFHGTVSRSEAEDLLKNDGDFLVRESMACPGQFVLTGLQGGSPKHLLLVDPEGIVRTKDSTFDNVIHLIKYHSDNSLPIISAESMVLLRNPVNRT